MSDNQFLDVMYNENAAAVQFAIDFLLYEAAIDEAPSPEEVAQWRDILMKRGGKFERYAHLCQKWLEEEAGQ